MKKLVQKFILFILLIGTASCTESLDFNQLDDLEATPIYEASILYLEAPENIINLVAGGNVFSQDYNFDAFSSDVFSSRVIDGSLIFEVENTTSKELHIRIDLLDDADAITDTINLMVPPAPTPVQKLEIAYGDTGRNIDIIKTLSTIRISTTNLGDNTSVSSIANPLVTLKSSGRFRLRLK